MHSCRSLPSWWDAALAVVLPAASCQCQPALLSRNVRRHLDIRDTARWGALVSAGPLPSPEAPPIRYSPWAPGSRWETCGTELSVAASVKGGWTPAPARVVTVESILAESQENSAERSLHSLTTQVDIQSSTTMENRACMDMLSTWGASACGIQPRGRTVRCSVVITPSCLILVQLNRLAC